MQESYIDRTFRSYGNDFFGITFMSTLTSEQIEEARVFAFREVYNKTLKTGEKCKVNTTKEYFLNYIFENFV